MVPREFESLADELVKRYESSVQEEGQGGEGLEVPELLTAEEQVKDFVFALGQSMLQSVVDVRVNQPTSGLEQSFDDLFALACIKGWDELTEVRGLADGARHIRPHMEMVFDIGNVRFILDRPHCKEHLSSAGEALETMTGVPAQQWAEAALQKLEAGKSAAVTAELKRAWEASGPDEESRNDTLRLEAGSFERNHDAVAYAYDRSQGWSTGSSEVESGHRHVVQVRVKISGAWWHPDHVDDILALRMLKANNWWNEYWDAQRGAWRTRAAKFAKTLLG